MYEVGVECGVVSSFPCMYGNLEVTLIWRLACSGNQACVFSSLGFPILWVGSVEYGSLDPEYGIVSTPVDYM